MTTPQPVNRWDAGAYAANAGFVPALGAPVLALLAPQPGERILDLGCGDGVLTEKLAASGADVLGVDFSPEMIAAARARGLVADVKDGQALDFEAQFDAVFTNAALHWMMDHAAVARGVFRALKPGGRFVGEFGGFGNIAALRTGIRAVLALEGYELPAREAQNYAEPGVFTTILAQAGFVDVQAELIHRPTDLPTGVVGWLTALRQGFMDTVGVSDHDAPRIMQRIEDFLAPILRRADGVFVADYVRLRFAARKPL
ncbi:MAG: class I SAM-dependent methyltransferase [Sphingomonadales bacterium]|nr:MAG: class I SAM-dependent methyltransferase [Sphingomonadales bacterium]